MIHEKTSSYRGFVTHALSDMSDTPTVITPQDTHSSIIKRPWATETIRM